MGGHPLSHQVTELWAWVADDASGEEGICASILPDLGTTPLITSKEHIAREIMLPMAVQISARFQKTVRLRRFVLDDVGDLEVINP